MGESPVVQLIEKEMGFGEAFWYLTLGKKIRRLSWIDDEVHVKLVAEKVTIFKPDDHLYHPLTVTVGDLEGDDWVICE